MSRYKGGSLYKRKYIKGNDAYIKESDDEPGLWSLSWLVNGAKVAVCLRTESREKAEWYREKGRRVSDRHRKRYLMALVALDRAKAARRALRSLG